MRDAAMGGGCRNVCAKCNLFYYPFDFWSPSAATLKLYVPSLNHNMHIVNISPQDRLTSAIYSSALKSTVWRTDGGGCDKMLKSKHDNYALERLKVEQVVVTERYSRDTAQWDKMRAFWHPRDEQTCVKITWFNGTIDGHIEGSKAMAQKSGLTGVRHTILPVDVTS